MALALSRQSVTLDTLVRLQVSPREIYGGHTDIVTCFCVPRLSPISTFHKCPIFIN